MDKIKLSYQAVPESLRDTGLVEVSSVGLRFEGSALVNRAVLIGM